ncbi:MAG TPA: S8 family serine peptidase [Streptosporangiaceae bacterium]|nr:S8 family serine peptidase [Streptosporangiaceae bacterium]
MFLSPRKAVSLFGAAALGVTLVTSVGWAAGPATGASVVSGPSFSKLSPGQVTARSSGKREPMVVVFDDQLTTLPDNQAHRRAREATAATMQAPLVAQLKQVRAANITTLSLLNAVAATMPAAEAQALSHTQGVKAVVPDGTIIIGDAASSTPTVAASQVQKSAIPATAADGQQLCNSSPSQPLVEPEALTSIHDASSNPNDPDEAAAIATGQGVIVGNVDANSLAGNPNMIRPNGQHVVIDAPNPNENVFSDEFNGDVSTIAAQGTVTYTYATQLPYSTVPANCSFRIVGDATGASLVSTGYFSDTNAQGQIVAPESQVIAGLQQAVNDGVNVVSESYGYGALPGANDDLLEPANDAMVAAGVVVVESAGDSGSSGTVEAPADDPNVIDVGGTNDLRLLAQADGYTKGWEDDNMTTLSSGGTAPDGRVVDLVAPGYLALAAAGAGQTPLPLPTEAFGGTSESAPFVSGAAADVIQAYRDTHGGATPTPAQVKQILTSTATDIGAAADQQGAGLLNVYAAVEAARQMPGTSQARSSTPELVDNPAQLDVQGQGGSVARESVAVYNASASPQRVSGSYRVLGSEFSLGRPVTENVSAPPAGSPLPAQGATAAAPISFYVPRGVSVLDADMRWPDPTNSDDNILSFILTDPAGRLAQSSYDYGAANGPNASPDIQHSTVEHPMAGLWTAQVLWANGRGHAQSAPDTPGPYTGTVTFQASGQNFTTSPASAPVTIPPRSSLSVPLRIALPWAPGDAPESVQFTGSNGLESSVPIARRTLIPSAGGLLRATLTSSVSRGAGQITTFYVDVPRGEKDLDVSFFAPDHTADDPVYYYLFSPADLEPAVTEAGNIEVTAIDTTPTPDNPTGNASLIAADPQPGLWEIDVMQGATTDGTEFSQTVTGFVGYNRLAPVTETGLPASAATAIDTGVSVPITVRVQNTTNHVGYFELQPSGNDIGGGNTVTPEELAPGATGTLTATLSPTAAAGSAVTGVLSVIDSTDWGGAEPALGLAASYSDFHDFTYAYTVGS